MSTDILGHLTSKVNVNISLQRESLSLEQEQIHVDVLVTGSSAPSSQVKATLALLSPYPQTAFIVLKSHEKILN